jgi:hypothetical protein
MTNSKNSLPKASDECAKNGMNERVSFIARFAREFQGKAVDHICDGLFL